jgi:hypothetical protein
MLNNEKVHAIHNDRSKTVSDKNNLKNRFINCHYGDSKIGYLIIAIGSPLFMLAPS